MNYQELKSIAENFRIYGDIFSIEAFGNGHINDTYRVLVNQAGTVTRYILRKINQSVFKNPEVVVTNIANVIEHQQKKLKQQNISDCSRRALTLLHTKNNSTFYIDTDKNYWNLFLFIENTKSYEVVENIEYAYKAAKAFGEFQKNLADIDLNKISETIPDFHNLITRYAAFEKALKSDCNNRCMFAKKEILFAQNHKYLSNLLPELLNENKIPVRITHNDTKLNNVLLDVNSGEGLCVIDLDTVMTGTALYDYGDMVRSFVSPAAEDEEDLTKIDCRLDYFESLTNGYLSEAKEFLNNFEKQYLLHGAKMIILVMGIRFLTDYLNGDIYYKISKPNHNLIRCRTQFKLLEIVENNEKILNEIIAKILQ